MIRELENLDYLSCLFRELYGGRVPDWLHLPPKLYRTGPRGGTLEALCLRLIMEKRGKLRMFPELLNVGLRLQLMGRLEAVGLELRIKGRRWRIGANAG